MKNCCYQCVRRKPGCHSKCQDYADFLAEKKKEKAAERKDSEYYGYVNSKR